MSNRLNPTKIWVNLHESPLQESFYAPAHSRFTRQFSSLWTPRLTRRILCSMTLSARNRLEGEVVEIQFGGVMAHISSALRFVTTLSIRFFPARMTIKSTEVVLEKNGDAAPSQGSKEKSRQCI